MTTNPLYYLISDNLLRHIFFLFELSLRTFWCAWSSARLFFDVTAVFVFVFSDVDSVHSLAFTSSSPFYSIICSSSSSSSQSFFFVCVFFDICSIWDICSILSFFWRDSSIVCSSPDSTFFGSLSVHSVFLILSLINLDSFFLVSGFLHISNLYNFLVFVTALQLFNFLCSCLDSFLIFCVSKSFCEFFFTWNDVLPRCHSYVGFISFHIRLSFLSAPLLIVTYFLTLSNFMSSSHRSSFFLKYARPLHEKYAKENWMENDDYCHYHRWLWSIFLLLRKVTRTLTDVQTARTSWSSSLIQVREIIYSSAENDTHGKTWSVSVNRSFSTEVRWLERWDR